MVDVSEIVFKAHTKQHSSRGLPLQPPQQPPGGPPSPSRNEGPHSWPLPILGLQLPAASMLHSDPNPQFRQLPGDRGPFLAPPAD